MDNGIRKNSAVCLLNREPVEHLPVQLQIGPPLKNQTATPAAFACCTPTYDMWAFRHV